MKTRLFFFTIALLTVKLTLAQWEPDVRLTYDTVDSHTGFCNQHTIAASGDTIHIVWWDDFNEDLSYLGEIIYIRSVDGGLTWEPTIQLTNGIDSIHSYSPSIAISGPIIQIAYYCAIVHLNILSYKLYYLCSIDGGNSWGDTVRLTNFYGDSFYPCLAVSDSITHLVYDMTRDWTHYGIYYKRSTDLGSTWEPDVLLTIDSTDSKLPTVYTSGPLVHLAWVDYRDDQSEIYYKRSVDNGVNWEATVQLTFNDAFSKRPCIGASGSNVYLVWQDERDQNTEIYFKSSVDGGLNWGEDTRLTYDFNESLHPNLAVLDSNLFVAWAETRDDSHEIYYKCSFDNGTNWSNDTRLTYDAGESNNPYIAVSGSQVNVTWSDISNGNSEIYYKRNPTGNLPVGVSDNSSGNDHARISVYPNPASSQITVGLGDRWQVAAEQSDVPILSGSAVSFSIVDIYGREVKNIGNIYSLPYQLDISYLPDGVYILKMNDDSGIIGAVKFVRVADGY